MAKGVTNPHTPKTVTITPTHLPRHAYHHSWDYLAIFPQYAFCDRSRLPSPALAPSPSRPLAGVVVVDCKEGEEERPSR